MTQAMNYQSPPGDPPPEKRSVGTWVLLLFIWTLGLGVWTIYLGIAALVILQIL